MKNKQVLAGLAIVCLSLCSVLLAQNADILAQEYDKAFYSGNYSVALPLIESLLAISPDNPDFHRERIKMLAMLDHENEFLDAFRKLRAKEGDSRLDRSEEIVKFPLLPSKYRELLKADAQSRNDNAFLEKFSEKLQLVQNPETGANNGTTGESNYSAPENRPNP